MVHSHSDFSKTNTQQCRQACQTCQEVCEETIENCLELGGAHATVHHIRMLRDCANICQLSANFMTRQSPYQTDLCRLCAQICTDCAGECDTFEDEFMKRCAEVCRDCAEACQTMVEEL